MTQIDANSTCGARSRRVTEPAVLARPRWPRDCRPRRQQAGGRAVPTHPSMSTQLFASTCGWCHSDGGRAAGKGPQLMNSARSDDFIRNRIKTGKEGAMPAFGQAFDDAQIDEIIKYIRALKPDQG